MKLVYLYPHLISSAPSTDHVMLVSGVSLQEMNFSVYRINKPSFLLLLLFNEKLFFTFFFFFYLKFSTLIKKKQKKPCIKFQKQEDGRSVLKMKQIVSVFMIVV